MGIPRGTPTFLAAFAAALVLLVAAGLAAAGGFSVTTLDPLAGPVRAGVALPVGYTLRAHGLTPIEVPDTGIAIVSAAGRRTVFPGRRQGPPGHYVAEVRFPAAGSWTWEQVQGRFTMQELGAVEVRPRRAAAAAAPARRDGPRALRWALLAATLAAAALLAVTARRLPPRRAA